MSFWKTLGAVFLGNKLSQPSTEDQKERALKVFGLDKLIDDVMTCSVNASMESFRKENGLDEYGLDKDIRSLILAWGKRELTKTEKDLASQYESIPTEHDKKRIIRWCKRKGIDLLNEPYPTDLSKVRQSMVDSAQAWELVEFYLFHDRKFKF